MGRENLIREKFLLTKKKTNINSFYVIDLVNSLTHAIISFLTTREKKKKTSSNDLSTHQTKIARHSINNVRSFNFHKIIR